MKKNLKKSLLVITTGSMLLSAGIGSSVLFSNLTSKNNVPVQNNNLRSLNQITSNGQISNDFQSFSNKTKFQLWNTNSNDIKYSSLIIPEADNKLNFRSQMMLHQSQYGQNFYSNSLNSAIGSNLLSFNNVLSPNHLNNLKNALLDAIKSVWTNDILFLPNPSKSIGVRPYFETPSVFDKFGNYCPGLGEFNSGDLSKAPNLFINPLINANSKKSNYFAVEGDWNPSLFKWHSGKNGGKWGPFLDLDLNKKSTQIIDEALKNDTSNLNLNNDSFKYSNLTYRINKNNFKVNQQFGGNTAQQTSYLRLFDNSIKSFQTGSIRDRSFDQWYKDNYTDYWFQKNGFNANIEENTFLGNFNTVNKLENIYVDFSKLITIDSNQTTTYTTSSNDVHTTTTAPKIQFGWNLELFSALKEVSNLATWMRLIYKDYAKISGYSVSLKNNVNRIIDDIYNQKVTSNEVQSYFDKVKRSGGVDNIYNAKSNLAEYSRVLNANNWNFSNKLGSVSTVGIGLIANEMQEKAFVYDYILPQIFKNDMYVNYQIEGNNDWITNELNTKIYDGKTKTFKAISMIDYGVAKKKYDNNVSMLLKNFYMKNSLTGQIIAGVNNNTTNNTLSANNIATLASKSTRHKITKTNNNELKITWKWNPGLNLVSNVNTGSKTRAIDTPWYFVSQREEDVNIVTKGKWKDLTDNVLKIPTKYAIDSDQSFGAADVSLEEYKWSSYPELIKSSKLMNNFLKYFLNPNTKGSKEYYDARRELNNLGYVYLNVQSSIPLDYYLTSSEYARLQKDNTFIANGKNSARNTYRYFVKYSFKAKPLKLSDLSKYLNIKFNSSNIEDPHNKYANKSLSIDFNTSLMSQDLANMVQIKQFSYVLQQNWLNEYFDVTFEEFWNEVIRIVELRTGIKAIDWRINANSFKYSETGNEFKEWNNWFYTNKWSYVKNSDTTLKSLTFNANIVTKYKELDVKDISSNLSVSQGDVSVGELGSIQDQLTIANEIQTTSNQLRYDFLNLVNKFKEMDLKIAQQKLRVRKLLEIELRKNESLNTKFDAIMSKYENSINEIIEKIKTNYQEYQKNNKYNSNGFVSSTLSKSFDYKEDLAAIKALYDAQSQELANLMNDAQVKQEIKDKVAELNKNLVNEVNLINKQLLTLLNSVDKLDAKNSGLLNFAENLVNFNSNQTIKVNLNTQNSYLANNVIFDHWIINANQNYQFAINQAEFLQSFNRSVNGTLNEIIGMEIDFTLDMFKLVEGKNQLTGFVQNDLTGTKTANIVVNYQIGPNKKINKLELEINIDSVNANTYSNKATALDEAKDKLNKIKEITLNNKVNIADFKKSIAPEFDNIKQTLDQFVKMGEVDLPNIFGTSQQAAKLEKMLNEYKQLEYSKTKLNDAFIGTLIGSILGGIASVTLLTIYLLSLRRKKTLDFTDEERKNLKKLAEEFNK